MKLILSSCDFRNKNSAECIYKNLPKAVDKCKVLFFPNEKSNDELIKSGMYHNRLSEFGFKTENAYVFNYWEPDKFQGLEIDIIYISGGNTFGTLKRIRESKADSLIIDYVKNGVLYIGGSAGAHIACDDICHVSTFDTNTFGLTEFFGLGLYDGKLICHYDENRYEIFKKLKKANNCQVTALTNDEFIVIEK